MEQAKPVKPARIRGSFPESYDGPRFYRVVDFDRWNNNPVRLFTIADKKLASRLFDETGNRDKRILQSGLIVDEAGKLLPEWQVPVRANIRKGVKSLYPEFYIGDGSPQLISARVQAIFEQLEPGKHIYVPVDAHWHDGGSERYYCFLSPHAVIYHALNPLANGQEPMTYNNGTPGWQVPGWLWDQCDHFGYLQASTVRGWHYLICENGARVFSEEMVTLLGDVLPKNEFFVPIGATDSKELLTLPYLSDRDRFDQAKAKEREVQRAHGFFHYHFRSEFRLSTFARWSIYIIGAHILAGALGLSARWIFKGVPPW